MGCRAKRPQSELIRIVHTADGSLAIGRTLAGRGAWLCAGSLRCFDLAARRNAFSRALRVSIDTKSIEQLRSDFVSSGPAVER